MKVKLLVIISLLFSIVNVSEAQSYEEALQIYPSNPKKSLAIIESIINDKSKKHHHGDAYHLQGYIYYLNDSIFKAIYSFTNAIEHRLLADDNKGVAESYLWLSNSYQIKKAYNRSEHALNQVSKYSNHLDRYVNYNLGVIEKYRKNYTEAVYKIKEAYNEAIEQKDSYLIKKSLVEIGSTYQEALDPLAAIRWYTDLLRLAESQKDDTYVGYAHNNIGLAYLQINLIDQAKYHLNAALPYQSPKDILTVYKNLGECYIRSGKKDSSKLFFERAINQAYTHHNIDDYMLSLSHLINLNSNDPAKIKHYNGMMISAAMSISRGVERVNQEADIAKIKIAELKSDKELNDKKNKERLYAIIIGSLSLMVLIIVVALMYKSPQSIRYRLKITQEIKEEQKRTIEQMKELLKY